MKLHCSFSFLVLVAILVLVIQLPLFAQKDKAIFKRDSIDFQQRNMDFIKDSILLAKEKIYLDRHPQDTEIGKFFLEDDKRKYRIRFGGFVKLVTYYDLGMEEVQFFDMYRIPTDNSDPQGRFNMRIAESRLNTEVIGNTSLGTVRLLIEGDFLGDGDEEQFRLRHAYGQFAGFTFGKTWTTWMDLEAMPLSVDLTGTNAILSARNAQVRYEYRANNRSILHFSIESPRLNLGEGINDSLTLRPQVFPDLVCTFKRQFDEGHLQVGGILRSLVLENQFTGDPTGTVGYGISVSTARKLGRQWRILAQGSYGKGVLRYFGSPFDIIPDQNGASQAPKNFAYYAALENKLNFRSIFTIYYSQIYIPEAKIFTEGTFHDGKQLNVNYLYDILPNLRTGVELIWGMKDTVSDSSGNAFRGYIMGVLSF